MLNFNAQNRRKPHDVIINLDLVILLSTQILIKCGLERFEISYWWKTETPYCL